MAQYQWQNNVRTSLVNAITNSQTSIEVHEAVAPLLSPPTPAGGRLGILTLVDNLYVPTKIEVITYTGVTDNGATLTLTGVVRGVDGTTGQAFDAGAPCYQALVKIMANHVQDPSAVAITGGTITGITDLAVADGGTGASDAATARTNLGLVIGTNVQAFDQTLAALAAADWVLNSFPIGSGANTVAQVAFAANTFPARASTGNLVAKAITDNSLTHLATGLGTMSTQAASAVAITGGTISGVTAVTATGEILADGATAAISIDRRDTGVKKWTLYSAAGNLQFYNQVGGAEPFVIADGAITGTLALNAGAVAIGTNLTVTNGLATVTVTSSTGTNGAYVAFSNTGGTSYIGVDNSAGGLFSSTAYDMVAYYTATRGLSVIEAGLGQVARITSSHISAKKAVVVEDVYAITAVSTAAQTRTLDLTNGAVQSLLVDQAFTLAVSGPSGKAGLVSVTVYNSSGASAFVTAGSGIAGGVSPGNISAGNSEILMFFWDGTRGWLHFNSASVAGDQRPT